MRAQHQHRGYLDRDEGDARRDPPAAKLLRELQAAVHGKRGVPGEEEVARRAVRDEHRRKSGAAPDHSRGWRQRAQALADLPQRKQHREPEERPEARSEKRGQQEPESDDVDERRGANQEPIGAARVIVQPAVQVRRSVVHPVLQPAARERTPSEPGLRDEPGAETSGYHQALDKPERHPLSPLFPASTARSFSSRRSASRSARNLSSRPGSRTSRASPRISFPTRASRSRHDSATNPAGTSSAMKTASAAPPP